MKKIVISDTHIGDKHADKNLSLLFETLDSYSNEVDEIVLNGDIFDLAKTFEIDGRHREFLSILQDYKNVTYIVGNHDWIIGGLKNSVLGIDIKHQLIETIASNNIVYMHGHQSDTFLALFPRLSRFLVKINKTIDSYTGVDIQRAMQKTWLLQKKVIPKTEKRLVNRVKDLADVLVTGHTHIPADKTIENIRYINTGDWVGNNCSYLLIDNNRLELVRL